MKKAPMEEPTEPAAPSNFIHELIDEDLAEGA